MSTTISLHDSTGPTTYDLPAGVIGATINQGFGLTKRQRSEQGAGSNIAFLIGDGAELANTYDITITIREPDETTTRSTINTIHTNALAATSVKHALPDGTTLYRAVLGLQTFLPTFLENTSTRNRRVRIVYLCKFARWTTSVAETLSAYDAATQVIV